MACKQTCMCWNAKLIVLTYILSISATPTVQEWPYKSRPKRRSMQNDGENITFLYLKYYSASGNLQIHRSRTVITRHSFSSDNSPMLILPPLRPFMAILKPCPSDPSRLVIGTAQSSNITALVGWEFQPTCKWSSKHIDGGYLAGRNGTVVITAP